MRARRAYLAAGLERSEAKAFEQVPRFRAWGTDIDGILQEMAAPLEGRHQLVRIVGRICIMRCVTKRILQSVLGCFAVAFQVARPLYSLFHHIYVYTDQLPEEDLQDVVARGSAMRACQRHYVIGLCRKICCNE